MQLLLSEEIYEKFIAHDIKNAKETLVIVTADIKDMHIQFNNKYVPFIELIADLVKKKVTVQLVHAKEPGPRFRQSFDRFNYLFSSDYFHRTLCPRVHIKAVIVDQKKAYIGSANLTGAGMGAKNANNRNFEAGIITNDIDAINRLTDYIDRVSDGDYCSDCGRRQLCPDPII